MAKIDILYGALMGAVSALFFAVTMKFPERSGGVNPRAYPLVIISAMFLLSLLLVGRGILGIVKKTETAKKGKLERKTVFRLGILASSGLVYAAVIETVGYLIATPFLIALAMVLFEEKKWYRILLVSVLTTVILYYLFRVIFRVPLPRTFFW